MRRRDSRWDGHDATTHAVARIACDTCCARAAYDSGHSGSPGSDPHAAAAINATATCDAASINAKSTLDGCAAAAASDTTPPGTRDSAGKRRADSGFGSCVHAPAPAAPQRPPRTRAIGAGHHKLGDAARADVGSS